MVRINPLSRVLLSFVLSRIHRIEGLDLVPRRGPFLLVSNHQSYLDPPIIAAVIIRHTGEKIHFLTQPGVYRIFGDLVGGRWFGMIPIDPNAKHRCLETALAYLRQGRIVGIFPEGGRQKTEMLGRGKTGAVRLALASGCPVIPTGVMGPPDQNIRDACRLFFSKREPITLHFGKPLDLRPFDHDPLDYSLIQKATRMIMRSISELSGKPFIE